MRWIPANAPRPVPRADASSATGLSISGSSSPAVSTTSTATTSSITAITTSSATTTSSGNTQPDDARTVPTSDTASTDSMTDPAPTSSSEPDPPESQDPQPPSSSSSSSSVTTILTSPTPTTAPATEPDPASSGISPPTTGPAPDPTPGTIPYGDGGGGSPPAATTSPAPPPAHDAGSGAGQDSPSPSPSHVPPAGQSSAAQAEPSSGGVDEIGSGGDAHTETAPLPVSSQGGLSDPPPVPQDSSQPVVSGPGENQISGAPALTPSAHHASGVATAIGVTVALIVVALLAALLLLLRRRRRHRRLHHAPQTECDTIERAYLDGDDTVHMTLTPAPLRGLAVARRASRASSTSSIASDDPFVDQDRLSIISGSTTSTVMRFAAASPDPFADPIGNPFVLVSSPQPHPPPSPLL